MSTSDKQALELEWVTLQNNIEQYERTALLIKLLAICLFTAVLIMGLHATLVAVLILIFWLQEAIFRTSQFRLGERIVRVEGLIKAGMQTEIAGFQLHSEWLASRKGLQGLLLEYLGSALKPTVAFPYAALLLIDFAIYMQAS
ncbi:hypothetical protein [Undibacterium terreum]|uniref:Uncharacterized protein n=1 Tax=Undibacterium terreum TaxID=1224302 RepID=A0A916US36_9BURK|nr:hypothetical protein [Undibacterium terreum]GGC85640.1 hypothetical protein GCM10011396_36210 [Undibacterium terreum]